MLNGQDFSSFTINNIKRHCNYKNSVRMYKFKSSEMHRITRMNFKPRYRWRGMNLDIILLETLILY